VRLLREGLVRHTIAACAIVVIVLVGYLPTAPAQPRLSRCATDSAIVPGLRISVFHLDMSKQTILDLLSPTGDEPMTLGDSPSFLEAIAVNLGPDSGIGVFISRGVAEDVQDTGNLCHTDKDIGSGRTPEQVQQAYGPPSRMLTAGKATVFVYDTEGLAFTIVPFSYAGSALAHIVWTTEVFHPGDFCRVHDLAHRAGVIAWDCSTATRTTSQVR